MRFLNYRETRANTERAKEPHIKSFEDKAHVQTMREITRGAGYVHSAIFSCTLLGSAL